MVIRERAIDVAEQLDHFGAHAAIQVARKRTGHAVAAVDRDLDRARQLDVADDALEAGGADVTAGVVAMALGVDVVGTTTTPAAVVGAAVVAAAVVGGSPVAVTGPAVDASLAAPVDPSGVTPGGEKQATGAEAPASARMNDATVLRCIKKVAEHNTAAILATARAWSPRRFAAPRVRPRRRAG